jgi:hypothetical protein
VRALAPDTEAERVERWHRLFDQAQGAYQLLFVRQEHALEMALRSLEGDRLAIIGARALEGWMNRFPILGEKPLCLNCPREFRAPHEAEAMFFIVPFNDDATMVVTSAICTSCARMSDAALRSIALDRYKKIWPDLRAADISTQAGLA